MAVNWGLAQAPDLVGAFQAGREQRRKTEGQNALAAYARDPNPQSLNALADYNPQFVVQQKQQESATQREAAIKGAEIIGQAAQWADTPEKWDTAVDYLSQLHPEFAQYRGKFSPELRMSAIAAAGQMKDYTTQNEGYILGPGMKRFDASNKQVAEAPFAPYHATIGEGQTLVEKQPGAPADPSAIFQRMIGAESNGQHFSPNGQPLTSPAGAIGIAQVMPQTAPEAARLAGVPFDEQRYRTDPAYNRALGQAYFQKQLLDFGDPALAVAAYNAGPDRVRQAVQQGGQGWLQHVPAETQAYVAKVMGDGAQVVAQGAPKQDSPPAPAGYRWSADRQSLEPIPGGPATRLTQQNKPIPASQENKLAEQFGIYATMHSALGSFQDDFAGNTITGGLENTMQGLLGTGTPGQRDWWANFRQMDNLVRNQMFGSALTATEAAAYKATTVSESMTPSEIRTNLQRRDGILAAALKRRARVLAAQGYNPEAISALFGDEPTIVDGLDSVKPSQPAPSAPRSGGNRPSLDQIFGN